MFRLLVLLVALVASPVAIAQPQQGVPSGHWVIVREGGDVPWGLLIQPNGRAEMLAPDWFESGTYRADAGSLVVTGSQALANGTFWTDTLNISIRGDTMIAIPKRVVVPVPGRGGVRLSGDSCPPGPPAATPPGFGDRERSMGLRQPSARRFSGRDEGPHDGVGP